MECRLRPTLQLGSGNLKDFGRGQQGQTGSKGSAPAGAPSPRRQYRGSDRDTELRWGSRTRCMILVSLPRQVLQLFTSGQQRPLTIQVWVLSQPLSGPMVVYVYSGTPLGPNLDLVKRCPSSFMSGYESFAGRELGSFKFGQEKFFPFMCGQERLSVIQVCSTEVLGHSHLVMRHPQSVPVVPVNRGPQSFKCRQKCSTALYNHFCCQDVKRDLTPPSMYSEL
jgi:hypothetical protein